MYKDYKKSESLDRGFVGGSGIMWMFSGIILGLLVGIGMYFFSNERISPFSRVDSVQREIKKAQSSTFVTLSKKQSLNAIDTTSKRSNDVRENKFSYYAVLPNLNVPVSAVKPIETRVGYTPGNKNRALFNGEDEVQEAIPVEVKQGSYLLQVASFKRMSKANLTRGRLSKKGIDAYVQKKKVKGRFWYRVVAGPVDQNSVDTWKLTAEKLGHHPLIISVR